MTVRRGTSNTACRGSAADRRKRKRALLVRDGDGLTAPCWECGTRVTFKTMICDRKKAGVNGGRYQLANLRVHCRGCSESQGARMGVESRRWKSWKARGLRTSRVSPGGLRSSLAGHWYVYLDGTSVGWLERQTDCARTWRAWRYSMTEAEGVRQEDWDGHILRDVGDRHGWRVGPNHKTMRAALCALLVEHTITRRKTA